MGVISTSPPVLQAFSTWVLIVAGVASVGGVVLSRLVDRLVAELLLELFGEQVKIDQRRNPEISSMQNSTTTATSRSKSRRSRATSSTSSSASWMLRSLVSSA